MGTPEFWLPVTVIFSALPAVTSASRSVTVMPEGSVVLGTKYTVPDSELLALKVVFASRATNRVDVTTAVGATVSIVTVPAEAELRKPALSTA